MRLASASQVLTLLGIQQSTGALENAGAALDIVTATAESLLETKLARATWTDFFDYELDRSRSYFEPVTFRLSSMFLDRDAALTVRESLTPMRATTDGTALATTDFLVDYDKGQLTLLRDVPSGALTLSVTYDAGFYTDSATKAYRDLPSWLEQAGRLAAQHHLSMNPAHIPGKKITAVKEIASGLRERLSASLNPHLRQRQCVIWASRTIRHD